MERKEKVRCMRLNPQGISYFDYVSKATTFNPLQVALLKVSVAFKIDTCSKIIKVQ